jgi:hypothetical protein
MKNKLFLVFLILILSSFLIYGIFIQNTPAFSPDSSSEISEGCNVLQENGNGINILFFSEREIAKNYLDYFLESSPFDESADNFNFFYIENEIPKCELYGGDVFYCYSRELVMKSSICPNDYIVVFGDYPYNIHSSAFMNVLSINSNHPKSVFLHEFGHVFANFAEEYVDENAKIPSKAKNCVSSCGDFGDEVECFEGCTKSNYYRSSFESVMRTLNVRDYGLFNNMLIAERISEEVIESNLFITGNVISSKVDCSKEEYHLLEFRYGEVSKSVHTGCSGTLGYGETEYLVLDEYNYVLFKGAYNHNFIFTTLPSPGGKISGGTYESTRSIFLKIPVGKIREGAKIPSTDFAILTKENEHLFDEKEVGDRLSTEEVQKLGKRDSERLVVKIPRGVEGRSEEFSGNKIDEKFDMRKTVGVPEGGEKFVRRTLFSLVSNIISDIGNLLFSGKITGNFFVDDVINKSAE